MRPSPARPTVVDVTNGSNSASDIHLKEGQKLQQLLAAFASDLYRPMTVSSIHEATHIGLYYDVRSGPSRVHQILKRLRAWLARAEVPLGLKEDDGFY